MESKKLKLSEPPLRELHTALVESFRDQDPDFLWDTGTRSQVAWPNPISLQDRISYIGREKAEGLYAEVLHLRPGHVMQILGAKGSGKSTVMAVIAGYLIGSGTKRAVYVSGRHYVANTFSVLKDALLLAWWGQKPEVDELSDIHDMAALQEWSCHRGAIFVVDDWDKVELETAAKKDLERACEYNVLIRISSINSRERYAYSTSQKVDDYIRTFEFDGPFTPAELETWILHSGLPVERLALLDYYTGGMPGLTRFYSESRDDASYRSMIQQKFTNRVELEIVAHLTNKAKVRAALELVTSHKGLPIRGPLEQMKLSCFYKEDYSYRILCPYLRTVAEQAIISQGTLLEGKLQLRDVQTWLAAVQADMDAAPAARNPARIGWNVEGLFIGVLRVQGQLVDNCPFAEYMTYAHGKELTALADVTAEALRGGVLLAPEAFSEKAVDIVYLILRDSKIEVICVEVTVAQWKAKKSYETWAKDVLPKWIQGLRESYTVELDHWYVMPKTVSLEDVPAVKVKAFSVLCSHLRFLDGIKLDAPKQVERCSGINLSKSPCGSTSK